MTHKYQYHSYNFSPIKYHPTGQVLDWGLLTTDVPSVWKKTRGKGVKIAILDTGIDQDHPDLIDGIKSIKDHTASIFKGNDIQGHGTHIAGIIGARDNGQGIIGVAPESDLYIHKVIGDRNFGYGIEVLNAYQEAINEQADIINISLGTERPHEALWDLIKIADQKGIYTVAAAGNTGPSLDTVHYPALYPEVISVGAWEPSEKVPEYSSRGTRVDIVAPGSYILSTYPPSTYAILSGTSMASPQVTGVLALFLSAFISQAQTKPRPSELRSFLQETSRDVGIVGIDTDSGYGLISPVSLLEKAFHVENHVDR